MFEVVFGTYGFCDTALNILDAGKQSLALYDLRAKRLTASKQRDIL
ncbi:MAG: hypothetical protein NC099_00420 [Corallococcus sp.]|nr:hypothetical protein [Bacillota bacterium]MCM1533098.1 hypothetical protein [Corallococcus sp.]